jgi:hypothetical protein
MSLYRSCQRQQEDRAKAITYVAENDGFDRITIPWDAKADYCSDLRHVADVVSNRDEWAGSSEVWRHGEVVVLAGYVYCVKFVLSFGRVHAGDYSLCVCVW